MQHFSAGDKLQEGHRGKVGHRIKFPGIKGKPDLGGRGSHETLSALLKDPLSVRT